MQASAEAEFAVGTVVEIHGLQSKPELNGACARVELFDLLEDPLERSDVAAAHPQQVASMTDALGGWRAAIRQRP